MATDGALRTDGLNVSDAPHVASDLNVESTHTAVPELPTLANPSGMDWLINR